MKIKRSKWAEIVSRLMEKDWTITTMEDFTSGGIASEITNIEGFSKVFRESFVTCCNLAKIKEGVHSEIIAKYSVYSSEVALCMANAAKKRTFADVAIGITGQPKKVNSYNAEDNLNLVWIAIIVKDHDPFIEGIYVPQIEKKQQKEFIINEIANTLLLMI